MTPSSPIDAVLADPARLLDAVCRVSGDYIVVVDRDLRMRFVNRTAQGLAPGDVLNQNILDFTSGDSAPRLRAAIDAVFAGGGQQSLATMVKNADGSANEFAVQVGPIVRDGGVAAVVICCEDITLLKRSERELNRERRVLRKLIDIQEQERQLVSYEIHDGLAQYLVGAIMHLEAYIHTLAGSEPRELADGVRLVRAAAEESRRLIAGLRPPALDELGIVDAIESLVADARIEIPRVEFTHALPTDRLSSTVETAIFRIVQESLTNARRHSGAARANVTVAQVPAGIHIRVSDDGCGFDPTTIPDSHFGLEGIRQRCRLFGVDPAIESAPGRGTTIDVVLPCETSAG